VLGDLGWQELLLVLVIVALLFGAGRVADMGGALGRGIRDFREAARPDHDDAPATVHMDQGVLPGPLEPQAKATVDAIVALGSLRDRGLLSDDEFEAKKAQALKQL
jgi:sec-independent protein translocase protein TatA